ncbi:hypothetical protein [Mucilaginibacter oryzae]|uniref:hypothetical protein n=1 Tax=Mucilaginibacter oryzae TaxID=468058 RepID=UPI0011B2563A|nr:hypothetical protein [Mucilaginibacter oryzae]
MKNYCPNILTLPSSIMQFPLTTPIKSIILLNQAVSRSLFSSKVMPSDLRQLLILRLTPL